MTILFVMPRFLFMVSAVFCCMCIFGVLGLVLFVGVMTMVGAVSAFLPAVLFLLLLVFCCLV